jgi:hypothetical protein
MSRYHHGTPASSQTPAQRLTELKLRIWGHVARKLLQHPSAEHTISSDGIESHKGRIGKAISDLRGLVSYKGTTKGSGYGSSTTSTYHVHDFETQSADLGAAPEFITTWQEYHDEIFKMYGVDSQNEFDRIGYIETDQLHNAHAIYVYWHQNEYDFIKDGKEIYVYPRVHCASRIKAMLRGIVEQHYQDDFNTRLERYLSIPTDSLKRDDTYVVKVRNFCARAADLSEGRYFGGKGFKEEYEHYRLYYEALQYNLNKLAALIQEKGGYANIIREMRQTSMQELLINAPLCINNEMEEIEEESRDIKGKFKLKFLNTFLLRNSEYFEYDTLYTHDESVTYMDDNKAMIYENSMDAESHEFTPDEEELQIIETYKKELACSQKNTSAA